MNRPWHDPRVQRGMKSLLALRRTSVDAGDECIGWKVAFGGKAVQERLGISAPLVGFLSQSRAVRTGESVSLAGWGRPVAEPEIAAFIGADLEAGTGREGAIEAIARFGPAIELIDSPVPPTDPEPVLAGNIAHRHVVLGPSGTAAIEQMRGRIFRRGTEVASTADVIALPGDPPALVAYVAEYLDAFGEKLRAGEVVICGSIVPPVQIESDEDSFRYALEPVGDVSVRFQR